MGHKHSVYDSDAHFSINPITKVIKNESSKKTTLVQGDHNSERFSFDIPRFIEGHDMMQCNLVEVHYDNKETGTNNISSDFYEVKDMQISPDDEDMVVFSWLIIDTATKYAGSLEFSIKFKCMTGDVCDYKWNTGINTDISVSAGKDNSGVVVERAPNVVDQWRSEIFGDAENAVANINMAEKEALEAIQEEGAAQVAAIQAEGTTQVENVRAAAEAIEASRDQIHLNNALKAAVIAGSAEGEVIVLDDSAEQPFGMFHVFGKSEQAKTNGYQLFDASNFPDFTAGGTTVADNDDGTKTISNGGVTITTSTDGSMQISGEGEITALFSARLDYTHEETIKMLKVGTLYCDFGAMTVPKLYIQINNESGTLASISNGYSSSASIDVTQEMLDDENVFLRCSFYQPNGTIVAGTIKPMLYQDGDGTWEEFSGGIPSPNPEYPQEIISVENPEVAVNGKNFAKSNRDGEITSSNITVTQIKDSSDLIINGTASNATSITAMRGISLASGRYVVSIDGLNVIDKSYDRIYITDSDDNVLVNYVRSGEPQQFNVEKETEVAVTIIFAKESTYNNKKISVQIELGDSKTNYEPYKAPQKISIPYTLHAIPVTSGGNYTDADGQQWICDEVDLERGVLVQRVELKTFVLSKSAYEFTPLGYRYQHHAGTGFTIGNTCLCKTMSYNNEVGTDVATTDGVRINKDAGYIIAQYTDELGTAETIDLDILYILPKPVETALTDEEIEAFKALHSNFPNTTIMNDAGAHMAVKYGIDTKTYIDKKFEELKKTILGES